MDRNARLRGVTLIGIVVVVALAALVAVRSAPPGVPDNASLPLVAQTTLAGPIAPDATDGDDFDALPRTPAGGECLDRIERPAGGIDLCWQAWREPRDGDPTKDYYHLQVYGSFGLDTGSGTRWVSVLAAPSEGGSAELIDHWPAGTYDGECTPVDVALGPGTITPETLCGRTTPTTYESSAAHRVDWTCRACLFPDDSTRAIALEDLVAVPAGTIPRWQIFADLGG